MSWIKAGYTGAPCLHGVAVRQCDVWRNFGGIGAEMWHYMFRVTLNSVMLSGRIKSHKITYSKTNEMLLGMINTTLHLKYISMVMHI